MNCYDISQQFYVQEQHYVAINQTNYMYLHYHIVWSFIFLT